MKIPDLQDVLKAHKRILPYLLKTPLHSYSGINKLIGTSVYIKHENYQPVGSFKVRGGINLISQLSHEEKEAGVIAASTGNHGQSVAYAAQLFGIKSRIVVPEHSNPGKVEAMKSMGAEIIVHGKNFDEARIYCESLTEQYGYRYVNSGDEPLLIAGVGTYSLEILQEQANIDTFIVPVGGGSGAAGTCIVAKSINPNIKVIGVQSESSQSAYLSWKNKELIDAPNNTFAEGLATGVPFKFPQKIMQNLLDDFILVKDIEIQQAMVWMVEKAHTLAEEAGSAALAAAYKLRDQLRNSTVALICSGGNVALEKLKLVLNNHVIPQH